MSDRDSHGQAVLGFDLDPAPAFSREAFAVSPANRRAFSLLDAWPDLREGMEAAIRAAGLPEQVKLDKDSARDHALTGSRYRVDLAAGEGRLHTTWSSKLLRTQCAMPTWSRQPSVNDL